MKCLLFKLTVLLLVSSLQTLEMPYEHMLSQLKACPKECHCPSSYPNAVYCNNRGLKKIPTIPPFTSYLYLQNNLIEVLSAEALRNSTRLKWINLNNNKITNAGVEEGALKVMTNLLHLYMEENLLTAIPSPLPPKLEQLTFSRNKISKIPPGALSELNQLILLNLRGNQLQDDAVTESSLKGLASLIQMNLAQNQLKNMPRGLPPTTTQLFLDGNNIEKIPEKYFKALPRVTFVRLNHNKLTDRGIPKNVFNTSSLLDLQLSHNQLTEVPLVSAHLEHLHLDHNNITRVNGSDICPVPLDVLSDADEGSPRLRYLRLDGNEIKPPVPRDLMSCFRLLSAVVI